MELAIYGAGSLGKNLYDVALRVNERERRWREIFFLDDTREEREFYGSEVRRLADVRQMAASVEAVVANGTPKHRRAMAATLREAGIPLTNLVDPSVIVAPSAVFTGGGDFYPFLRDGIERCRRKRKHAHPAVCTYRT